MLSDEEDGETASAEVTLDKTVKDEATQALEPDESTEDILDEASCDEDFIPGGKKKECQKHDIQPNQRWTSLSQFHSSCSQAKGEKSGRPCVCPSCAAKHEGISLQVSWPDKG